MDRLNFLSALGSWNTAGWVIINADRRGLLRKLPRLRQAVAWHIGKRKTCPPLCTRTRRPLNLVIDSGLLLAEDGLVTLQERPYLAVEVLRSELGRKPKLDALAKRALALDVAATFRALAEHLSGPTADVRHFADEFRRQAEQFLQIADAAGTEGRPPLEAEVVGSTPSTSKIPSGFSPRRCSPMSKAEIARRYLNTNDKKVRSRDAAVWMKNHDLKFEGNGRWTVRLPDDDLAARERLEAPPNRPLRKARERATRRAP